MPTLGVDTSAGSGGDADNVSATKVDTKEGDVPKEEAIEVSKQGFLSGLKQKMNKVWPGGKKEN